MRIYKQDKERSDLINTDHVQAFYVNGNSVYAAMDASSERVISLDTEYAAREFLHWIAEHIGIYKGSRKFGDDGSEVIVLIDK
jgi:hypothetical protein